MLQPGLIAVEAKSGGQPTVLETERFLNKRLGRSSWPHYGP